MGGPPVDGAAMEGVAAGDAEDFACAEARGRLGRGQQVAKGNSKTVSASGTSIPPCASRNFTRSPCPSVEIAEPPAAADMHALLGSTAAQADLTRPIPEQMRLGRPSVATIYRASRIASRKRTMAAGGALALNPNLAKT